MVWPGRTTATALPRVARGAPMLPSPESDPAGATKIGPAGAGAGAGADGGAAVDGVTTAGAASGRVGSVKTAYANPPPATAATVAAVAAALLVNTDRNEPAGGGGGTIGSRPSSSFSGG